MTTDTWQRAVLDVIERLVGAEQTAKLAGEWSEHAARDKVEVTFLGPYSSGKSTLLRRLIVDGGGEIPEWLTVSGRRETFELNAVDVGDLTFTDTPGFAAGSELHDELAQDALALSDAFLLVVPPQLLTTDREFVGSVLSGRYFYGDPCPDVGSVTIAVVAQADSMGVDPDDDVEGMRQLAERKRSELRAQLEDAADVSLAGLQTFCVAADPYEEQARQSQPQRSAFDPYREWDGIDRLTAALASLPGRHGELRHGAGIRYFCRVGGDVAAQAGAVVDEMTASAEELQARQVAWAVQKARVDTVIDAARGDLETILVILAGELSDELGVDQAESRSQINQRMTVTLDHWAQRWDGELDLVLGEAGMQVDERLARPRAKRTEAFLRSITVGGATVETPEPNSRVISMLNGIKGELHTVARETFELCTGASLEQLLSKGRRAGSAAKTAARVAKAKEASDKAAKAAVRLDASLQIADAVITVVSIVDAERRQQVLDAQRRRQREEAQDRIEQSAGIVATDIVDGTAGEQGWRARADAVLETLRERLGLLGNDTAVDELFQQVAAQQQLVSDLRALLTHGSQQAGGST